ncbi:MAG: hypothetical protein MRY63_09715 [Neomegalonema sp.]|nr:hypothetical protein [Neomegalonema sp.]
MNPYSRFSSFSSAVYFVLLGFSFTFIRSEISDATQHNYAIWESLLFFILALSNWFLVEFLIAPFFSSTKIVRKALLGSSYIEGVWIEDVQAPDGDQAIAVVCIRGDSGGLTISGINYSYGFTDNIDKPQSKSIDIKPSGIFKSRNIVIEWPSLIYFYDHHRRPNSADFPAESDKTEATSEKEMTIYDKAYSSSVKNEGIGEIQFEIGNSRFPTRFDGYFHHLGSNLQHSVFAYKLNGSDIERLSSANDRIAFLKTKILEFHKSKARRYAED